MRETTVGSDFDDPLGGEDLPREVEAAAGEQAVAAPGTEPDKDPEPWNVRRLAPYVSVPRLKVAERARHGDPEALRIVLNDLAEFLEGGKELEPAFANFCSVALKALTSRPKVWKAAVTEFQGLDRSEVPTEAAVTGYGPRVSEAMLRRLGSAFCRAFSLSKPQGRGEKYDYLLTPAVVWRVYYLRLLGTSLNRAIRIVRSCRETDLSDHQIKEWFRQASWLKMNEPGTHGFCCGEHERRLRLAVWVLHRTERGLSFEEACEEVGRLAVTKLCFLPAATIFLKPETVKEAYEYAATCEDPRWERVKRLVPRFAKRERLATG